MKPFFAKKRLVSFLLAFVLLITSALPSVKAVEDTAPAAEKPAVETVTNEPKNETTEKDVAPEATETEKTPVENK